MTQILLPLGIAECVWSLRPLLPGNSQAVRLALYAKGLYFIFFSFLFLKRGDISFLFFFPLCTLFFRKWQQVGVSLDLRKGVSILWSPEPHVHASSIF